MDAWEQKDHGKIWVAPSQKTLLINSQLKKETRGIHKADDQVVGRTLKIA